MRYHFACILPLILLVSVCLCTAQESSQDKKKYRLVLTDGSELNGTIVRESADTVVFRTVGDVVMTVPRSKIQSLDVLSGKVSEGKYIRSDPNQSRLFFSPTARSLRSGQGYFSAYEIFFPFAAIGIADRITLGGGISIFPVIDNQIFYLAPKVTLFQTDNLSAATGLLYVNSTAIVTDGVGVYYFLGTYGTSDAGITGGLGWGFYGDDIADKPVMMIGGELRVSNSIKLISENWVPANSDVAVISYGIRFFGDQLSADLAIIQPVGTRVSDVHFMPWLGFTYNFGNTR